MDTEEGDEIGALTEMAYYASIVRIYSPRLL